MGIWGKKSLLTISVHINIISRIWPQPDQNKSILDLSIRGLTSAMQGAFVSTVAFFFSASKHKTLRVTLFCYYYNGFFKKKAF